jgi:ribosomal RNA assembly protein
MYVKIPQDRIGAVIGPKGATKQAIEELSTATLDIDSESGNVQVLSPEDPLRGMRAVEVISAIGRGFSPERAVKLFGDELLIYDVVEIPRVHHTLLCMVSWRRSGGNLLRRGLSIIEVLGTITTSKPFGIAGMPPTRNV